MAARVAPGECPPLQPPPPRLHVAPAARPLADMDYWAFYSGEVALRGAAATLAAYWPRLAPGLGGDLFHAVIQLGYAFESGVDGLVAQASEELRSHGRGLARSLPSLSRRGSDLAAPARTPTRMRKSSLEV